MKILIIGGGGREHAIAAAFAKNESPSGITVAPGNAGIAKEFTCLALKTNAEILDWCLINHPDLVFIGPEKPLAEGLADILTIHGIPCVGPSQAAARLETSKIFAKDLMAKYSIPTANYACFSDPAQAEAYIREQKKYPLVVKADCLAAGKGVTIAAYEDEAIEAVRSFEKNLDLASGVVVEEYLQGWEVSLFAVTDGVNFHSTLFAQDHKQIGEQDTGPNTGGMGAYCPVTPAELYRGQIESQIISPILKAMRDEGCPYRGWLYCGLMITKEGPKVLEFNCRLGDPETQAMLPLLNTPMMDVCAAIIKGQVDQLKLDWSDQSSICVVLASQGYPGAFTRGHPVKIRKNITSRIYFSGVGSIDGKLVTGGGRVLSLVALGKDIAAARRQVYQDVDAVDFAGKTYRRDISQRTNTL